MSLTQTKAAWGALLLCLGLGLAWSVANSGTTQEKQPHELLSVNTVAYIAQAGSLEYDESWKKTAAYEAMYESGVMDLVEKVGEFITSQMPSGPGEAAVTEFIEGLAERGMSIGIAMNDAGMPSVSIVLHDGAGMQEQFAGFLNGIGAQVGIGLEEKEISGRKIQVAELPQMPGLEVALMADGGHLLLTAGIGASAEAVAVATGASASLSANPVWKKYNLNTEDYDGTTVAWLDTGKVAGAFNQFPIPDTPLTVGDVLKAVGLHNLNTLAYQYGYKGRSLWSEVHADVGGERTGLLGIASGKPMTLKDLPPLPARNGGFTAFRCDPAEVFDSLTEMAHNVAALGPPGAEEQVNAAIEQIEPMLGFNPRDALLAPMGDIACVFTDPEQGLFGLGSGVVVSVDDAETLQKTFDQIFAMITQMAGGDFSSRKVTKHGRQMTLFKFANRAEVGSLMIDDKWMVISLMPQTCEAFALRMDGKLPAWKPSADQAAAFAELPKQFNSISVGDPRLAWSTIMKIAPAVVVGAEVALREEGMLPDGVPFPISASDIPPAELVTAPLFDNVTVGVVDDTGFHTTSRQSLPGIPFLGGGGDSGTSVATSAVLVALLLPAIQQAREAARRTQSKNNLKQLALAMHNYHDVYNRFPIGSHPNEKLKPDQRFSWMARILPFAEQVNLYEALDFEESWDDDANQEIVRTRIPVFMHPSFPAPNGAGPAPTHYVGLAGVGRDGPELPVRHARAGVFGHNRKTGIQHILDGTSNTLMISEASRPGNWAQGGLSTYRPITRKPYINGPDGIGGPSPGGANMAFADGSVRFISENIDPEVFEALNTIAGREVINVDEF